MSLDCLCKTGQTCHASAVAVDGAGVLIVGASGTGKSRLSLELIALGAQLIADDQTICGVDGDARPGTAPQVLLRAPEPVKGLIEARGIGILRAPTLNAAPLRLVVDLDREEPHRLPPRREILVAGRSFPLILGQGAGQLAPALLLFLRDGRVQ